MTSTRTATQKANSDNCARKLRKIICKAFHSKAYFTQFCVVKPILLSFVYLSTIFYLALCICLQYFVKDSLKKHIFISNTVQTPWNLYFLLILVFQETHLLLKLIFRATEMRQRPKFDLYQKAPFCTFVPSINLRFQLQQGSIYEDVLLFSI